MSTYKTKKGFIVNKLGEKITVLDPELSVLYSFNQTATYIFKQIKQKKEKDAIVNTMIKKFAISKERAEKDFDSLIEDMKKKNIIEEIEA